MSCKDPFFLKKFLEGERGKVRRKENLLFDSFRQKEPKKERIRKLEQERILNTPVVTLPSKTT